MSGLKEAVAEALLLEQQTIEEISKTYEIQPEGYAILKSGDKFMVVKMDEDRVTKVLKTFNEKERKPTTNISLVPIY